jgi:hypothetical protein
MTSPKVLPSFQTRRILCALAIAGALLGERPVAAYSILAHEGAIDGLWDADIAPLLQQRFGRLTSRQLAGARAYAYGGALIQDLGYYPFGSHLFTNLTHYVRSGDFVEALIRNATDANEYAFALGALAHYTFDNAGHPLAVNRAVPMMYPKLQAKVGPTALYVDSPARHIMVEFAFDVLQVARGGYAAQEYRDRIGFQVSKRLLERAVEETYAIPLDDLLLNVDLAIGTYRRAVGTTIPELTRIAWQEKKDEIAKRTPDVSEHAFVYMLSRRDYEREFGSSYRKPGILARMLAFVLKILPKIGPTQPLAFEPLTADAEGLFLDSVTAAHTRFRIALQALRRRTLVLPNTDFDTGRAPVLGANRLADQTYAELLHKLAHRNFVGATPRLRHELDSFFSGSRTPTSSLSSRKTKRLRGELALLRGERTKRNAP